MENMSQYMKLLREQSSVRFTSLKQQAFQREWSALPGQLVGQLKRLGRLNLVLAVGLICMLAWNLALISTSHGDLEEEVSMLAFSVLIHDLLSILYFFYPTQ